MRRIRECRGGGAHAASNATTDAATGAVAAATAGGRSDAAVRCPTIALGRAAGSDSTGPDSGADPTGPDNDTVTDAVPTAGATAHGRRDPRRAAHTAAP